MLSKLKNVVFASRDIFRLLIGLTMYNLNFITPYSRRTRQKTNVALVNTFCRTKGRSNDLLNNMISFFDREILLPNRNGILGNLSIEEIEQITKALDENGYYIFSKKLPENICTELLKLAKIEKFEVRPMDNELMHGKGEVYKEQYDPKNLKTTRYVLDAETCINNKWIQTIISDFSILSVTQSYLRSSPKFDSNGLWWNTNYSNKPQEQGAELFHFDMDRPKWLKFFIYLTDVTLDNGPHQFVRGSHRTGGIPNSLLKKGYARISDQEINRIYHSEDIVKYIAPKGTIIAEDTRGLHKATKIQKGDRLMLQLQYSNSLFGSVTTPAKLKSLQCENMKYLYENYRKLFRLYL